MKQNSNTQTVFDEFDILLTSGSELLHFSYEVTPYDNKIISKEYRLCV